MIQSELPMLMVLMAAAAHDLTLEGEGQCNWEQTEGALEGKKARGSP